MSRYAVICDDHGTLWESVPLRWVGLLRWVHRLRRGRCGVYGQLR